jgi:hypothetical protein
MFVNCTPHTVNVYSLDGKMLMVELPKGERVARVSATVRTVAELNMVVLTAIKFGEVLDLPEPRCGVHFVVSAMVRQAVPNRLDLCSPGELVRDSAGQPVGCRGLVINT